MSDPQSGPPIPSAGIPLEQILSAISVPVRWYLLRELASGESLMVSELAERIGQSPDATSKNIGVLRNAGIVIQGRGRLYRIAPHFLVDKDARMLDFGYCLLRMNVGALRNDEIHRVTPSFFRL
jgi:DNA-binding transcriptional ArsR family regulator